MIPTSNQHFDACARAWDKEKMHMDRSIAIAAALQEMIPLQPGMKALEYGAGTGILSFLLKDAFAHTVLMDNSAEMIKVCEEKVAFYNTTHIQPVAFDLENSNYPETFDIIYTQMVLHHIMNVAAIFKKFAAMLNPGGYLAIADLYTEDGSFHEPGMQVHKGFEPTHLQQQLTEQGLHAIQYKPCFEIKRDNRHVYPVFLLTAQK